MSLEQAITENTAAIRDLIASLSRSGVITHGQSTGPSNEKTQPDPQPVKEKTAEAAAAKQAAADADADTATKDDCSSAITKLAAKSRPKALQLLEQYGVKKGSEVPEGKRGPFVIDCAKLLAAA